MTATACTAVLLCLIVSLSLAPALAQTEQQESTSDPNQITLYALIIASILATVTSSLLGLAKLKQYTLNPKQRRVTVVTLACALIVAVGAVAATPMSESQVPLSFRDINLLMQTLWLSLLLISMWFRRKGNYFIHGVLAVVVVSVTLVSFLGVLAMSPMSDDSMAAYFTNPAELAVLLAHGVFSIPAIAFGVWLVLLWRPNSSTFPAKSRRAAWLTIVFWVLSYVVGVLDYIVIRNSFL